MVLISPSDFHFQAAVDLARRMASHDKDEASIAWEFAWKRRLSPHWADILLLVPCILVTEYAEEGLDLTRRWLSTLAINSSTSEEDLGDQGLALALISLRALQEIQPWQEAEIGELEHTLISTWIERICEAGRHKGEYRLKRLYGLAREISGLDAPTILFTARSLQTRFSESLRQDFELRHDLEGALEFLLGSAPHEIIRTLLSQDLPEGDWGFMGLEHALFLRGAQAPIDGLLEIACSSRYPNASRTCALNSLRLLGLSGLSFSVESLLDLLDEREMRGPTLWALSTQGTRVPPEIFQQYLAKQDAFLHRVALAGLSASGRPASHEMLLKALQDEDTFVRIDAIWTLCRSDKDVPMDIVLMMLHDRESYVRKETIYALSSLGKRAPATTLLEATQEEDMFVRQTAMDVLGGLDDALPAEPMLRLLQQRAEPFTTIAPNSMHIAAIRALGKAGNPIAVPALQEKVEDADPRMVLAAVEALQQLGVQPALQSLLTLPRFRSPLIRAMSKLGERQLREVLLQPSEIPLDRLSTYLHHQNTRIQGSARHALWTIGQQMDLPVAFLLSLLEQPAGFPLAHVLGENCQKFPVEPVSELFTAKQPGMRGRVIELLGKRGVHTPVELLIPMLQDENSRVRFIATETLAHAIGMDSLFLFHLFSERLWPQVSAVDLCADVIGWDVSRCDWQESFVSRAVGEKVRPADLPADGPCVARRRWKEIATLDFGKHTSPISCCIYHKTAEIRQQSPTKMWFYDLWKRNGWNGLDAVWRVEFRMTREFLHAVKIESVFDLPARLSQLWEYCAGRPSGAADGLPDGWSRSVVLPHLSC